VGRVNNTPAARSEVPDVANMPEGSFNFKKAIGNERVNGVNHNSEYLQDNLEDDDTGLDSDDTSPPPDMSDDEDDDMPDLVAESMPGTMSRKLRTQPPVIAPS
jgi:hypothetical protein